MSSTYNGLAGNQTRPAVLSISSSTNANPIAITTTANHGLTTGDKVTVSGHQVNYSANGEWTATVTGNTTFTIAVAGSGAGAATGTVQPLTTSPTTFTIPSDGDTPNAASVNVALEALADRTAWLEQRHRSPYSSTLAYETVMNTADDSFAQWAASTNTSQTWTVLATSGQIFAISLNQVVLNNDLVEIYVQTSASNGATYGNDVGLAIAYANVGEAFTNPTAPAAGSVIRYPASYVGPVNLYARFTYTSANAYGQAFAGYLIQRSSSAGGGAAVSLIGHRTISVRVWRPN